MGGCIVKTADAGPTSAHRLIEHDRGRELIGPQLREAQVDCEQAALRVQLLEIRGVAGAVTIGRMAQGLRDSGALRLERAALFGKPRWTAARLSSTSRKAVRAVRR
jgi:hypothetical protein